MTIRINNEIVAGKNEYLTFSGADGTHAGAKGLVPKPSATDNTKFLQGDGTWQPINQVPSQTGQNGKYLRTDGTTKYWDTIHGVDNQNAAVAGLTYDWVGTEAQYNAAWTAGTIQPTWKCFITDDQEEGIVINQTTFAALSGNPSDNAALNTALSSRADTSLANITSTGLQVIKDNAYVMRDLLQPFWSDHKLNNMSCLLASTFSWQDGTVYSEAYNHLREDLATATLKWQTSNITKVGGLTDDKGTLSGFSSSNYAYIDPLPLSTASSIEIVLAVFNKNTAVNNCVLSNTSDNYTAGGFALRTDGDIALYIWATTNKSSWTTTKVDTGVTLSLAKTYVKMKYDGTNCIFYQSADGITWTEKNTVATGRITDFVTQTRLGITGTACPLTGNMYLNECYIKVDNNYWWKGTTSAYEATDGHRIVLPAMEGWVTEQYNKTGNSTYYIFDQANVRFKLPRGNHGELIETYKNGSNGYRIYSDGWCEQWSTVDYSMSDNTNYTVSLLKAMANTEYTVDTQVYKNYDYGSNNNQVVVSSRSTSSFTINKYEAGNPSTANSYRVSWIASGYLASTEYDASNSLHRYLYFFAGQFTQSAIEQTAGITAEQLNSKVDMDSLVETVALIETYKNGTEGYRVWSDGYCEQYGYNYVGSSTASTSYTITFMKRFANTKYHVTFGQMHSSGGAGVWGSESYSNRTTSSMVLFSSSAGFYGYYWKACGYLQEGQY